MALQEKIDKAFDAIISEYADSDLCMGELLADIKCSDYDLTMEEAFILNMRLRNAVDGDEFYRKINGCLPIEKFDNDNEWFNV